MLGKFSISNLPSVLFDGVYRVLGLIPSSPESLLGFPNFSSIQGLDPAQWQEIDLQWYNPPILDQGSTSACAPHASTSGMEMCYLQSGRLLREFNPFFVYALVNNGRDAGSMLSDCMRAMMQYGICPKEDMPAGAMFQQQIPQQAYANAKRFLLINAFRCQNFDEICSAISLGFVCPLGLLVGSNFASVDSDGVCPLPNGGGGGHAVLGMGLKKNSKYGWLIKIKNSWGPRFGNQSYAFLRREALNYMPTDAFAIQSVIDDPQDNNPSNVPVVPNP